MLKSVILAAGLLLPVAAIAQPQCAEREDVLSILTQKYGESRYVAGMDRSGRLVEVWGNLESGSWTITTTRPDMVTCLAAEGHNLELTGGDLMPTAGDPA